MSDVRCRRCGSYSGLRLVHDEFECRDTDLCARLIARVRDAQNYLEYLDDER